MNDPLTLTGWRGNPYTVGTTTILYPRGTGGSCEIQEGIVLEIWEIVYDLDKFRRARSQACEQDRCCRTRS
ncbi:hypothetical protein ACFQYP_00660 [Nonomuraea antimicrobica]